MPSAPIDVQANRVAHLQCQGCRTWLMYAHGARSVRCAVCEAITRTAPDAPAPAQPSGGAGPHPRPAAPPTSAAGPAGGEGGGDAGPAQAAAAPELPAVVVQNPPTLDDDGNEVRAAAARAGRPAWHCRSNQRLAVLLAGAGNGERLCGYTRARGAACR